MILSRADKIPWDIAITKIPVQEVKEKAAKIFVFNGDGHNYMYLFKTEYTNLFTYTTTNFMEKRDAVGLSLLLFDELTNEVFFSHPRDYTWTMIEGKREMYRGILADLMLTSNIEKLLVE